jgi:hypothetical protein
MFKSFKPLVGLLLVLAAGLASATTNGAGKQGDPSPGDLKSGYELNSSTASTKASPFEAPTAAPEPGAIALMLAGIAMIGTLSRRRKP